MALGGPGRHWQAQSCGGAEGGGVGGSDGGADGGGGHLKVTLCILGAGGNGGGDGVDGPQLTEMLPSEKPSRAVHGWPCSWSMVELLSR